MRHGINITTNQMLSPTFRGNGNTIIVGDSQTSPLSIFPEGGGTPVHRLRALRLMFFAEPRTRAVPLFLETKQLPISFLLFEQMNLLMYDVHNNLAPDNIKNMFTKLSSIHSYRTRSVTNENYYVEQVITENMKRAFSVSGALIWNSIPLLSKHLKKSIQKRTKEKTL